MRRHPGIPIGALALLALLTAPGRAAQDYGTWLHANRLSFPVSNVGLFGYDPASGNGAFEFPKGSGKTCLFAGGLWVGAKVDGALRVALAEYSTNWAPGPMVSGPYADAPEFHVYEVSYGDTAGWASWLAYAAPQGAPTDSGGLKPLVLGSQTLWAIYNDTNPARHTNHAGTRDSLGIEVAQLAWSYEELSPRRDMAFLRYRLRNGSAAAFDSVYIALWADVDLGGASDDRMGSDRARNLVYTYNGDDDDFVYGEYPPAIGFKLLEGPPVTAMNTYVGGNDPETPVETWGLLHGLTVDGPAWFDPVANATTRFPYSGDPVTGAGWTQPVDSESRMMIVSGPFTMAPGDTQSLTYAIVLGEGLNRLDSIAQVRANADSIDLAGAYAPLVPIPPDPNPGPDPVPSHTLAFARPVSPLAGLATFRFVAPPGAAWRLAAFDARGRRVARIAEGTGNGFADLANWSPAASGLSAGVYWVRLSTASDGVVHKVVVVGP